MQLIREVPDEVQYIYEGLTSYNFYCTSHLRPIAGNASRIKIFLILYFVINSPDLFLSVFGTETIIYNNGSIDISDTF